MSLEVGKKLDVERLAEGDFRETISFGDLSVEIRRTGYGLIDSITPIITGQAVPFIENQGRYTAQSEKGLITIETQPPKGLEREKSGHPPIPIERQCWIVDITNDKNESITTTIPIYRRSEDPSISFTATETEETRKHPFIPFALELEHPDIGKPKTDIIIASQVFGHISGVARLLKAMPDELQKHTYIAAKNRDNVPKVVEHIKNMGIARPEFMVPLTYDDIASGGSKIADRKAAIWWLAQNPELVDRVMESKVIISDFREETAWFKHIADCMKLPQMFLGSTYAWPQHLFEMEGIPPKFRAVLKALPTTEADLIAMKEVGLEPNDAVHNWFRQAEDWKAGTRKTEQGAKHAYAADAVLTYSLASPRIRPVDIDNVVVSPPRTNLETDATAASLWTREDNRIMVLMGSGDWTERDRFIKSLIISAKSLPNCEMIIVGPSGNNKILKNIPKNVQVIGFVPPHVVDGLIKSCTMAIIKPGHFSFEETAQKITVVAPPDKLANAVKTSKREKNPRAVAIAVEVMDERYSLPYEEWLSLGAPDDFFPLIASLDPKKIRNKIMEALRNKDRFRPILEKTPCGGTELLAKIIGQLIEMEFTREQIPDMVRDIKSQVESMWPKLENAIVF